MENNKGTLFVISAPSGGGKTTLVNAILAEKAPDERLERVVTYTTKKPRKGEIEGQSYFFVDKADFEAKIEQGFFLEWSGTYGHYYGSPASVLTQLNAGTSLIMILDRAGARAVKDVYPDAILIWIKPPSIEELEKRLVGRGSDSADSIKRRLGLAIEELKSEKTHPFFGFNVINDDFEKAKKALKTIFKKRDL
ncbi:guanylate kinase [bacterium]|jgi:guanylate kinase|nr:guanylate kinase [bacterium]MBT5015079.1 guanylate kinase [bacterium]